MYFKIPPKKKKKETPHKAASLFWVSTHQLRNAGLKCGSSWIKTQQNATFGSRM